MAIFPVTQTVTTKTVTRTSNGAQEIAAAAVASLISGAIIGTIGWVLYKLETEPAFELGAKPTDQQGAPSEDQDRSY